MTSGVASLRPLLGLSLASTKIKANRRVELDGELAVLPDAPPSEARVRSLALADPGEGLWWDVGEACLPLLDPGL
jgi:hypothetical protein